MQIVRPAQFTGTRPWEAMPVAEFDDIRVRLHWTDQAYDWHVNDGCEVFTVVDGEVEMHYRTGGEERMAVLRAGDTYVVDLGEEHFARPRGPARVLVTERRGSA